MFSNRRGGSKYTLIESGLVGGRTLPTTMLDVEQAASRAAKITTKRQEVFS
jgi:hypothetical protein